MLPFKSKGNSCSSSIRLEESPSDPWEGQHFCAIGFFSSTDWMRPPHGGKGHLSPSQMLVLSRCILKDTLNCQTSGHLQTQFKFT